MVGGGAICDVLTISGLNWPQGHYYIARPVSEFLIELYPAFGLHILNWITRIRKRYQEMETITNLHDSTSMRSVMSQEVVVMGAAYIISKGQLEDGTLIWAISTNSEELASGVKSALIWTLSALQRHPQGAEGLYYWVPVSLDVGLPERAIFN